MTRIDIARLGPRIRAQVRAALEATEAETTAKRHKYGAKSETIDGHRFPSKKEARRYCTLKMLAQQGMISGLKIQPKFPIMLNGVLVTTYIADFEYVENGKRIYEDAKGYKTPVYRLKKKLVEAVHKIKITET